jgi:hypothetical protein
MAMRVWKWTWVAAHLLMACGEPAQKKDLRYHVLAASPMVRGDQRTLELVEVDSASHMLWRSSNPDIVSTTLDGRIHALHPGSAVITGTDGIGRASINIEVSNAVVLWSTPLALQPRTLVAVDDSGWVFARTTGNTRCDWACPGEMFVLSASGEIVTSLKDVGRTVAGNGVVWFESMGEILRWNYATRATETTGFHGRLLGRFQNGDFLMGIETAAVRLTQDGVEINRWQFNEIVTRALILKDDEVIVSAGDEVWSGLKGATAKMSIDNKWVPWAADGQGQVILNDPSGYNFSSYRPLDGLRILHGVYSVLVSQEGLVESHGLTAALSVPVDAEANNMRIDLEMRTFGNAGQYRTFDVVKQGAETQWRWGPSACTDHPFSVAVREGYAIVSNCDRIVRINDSTLKPAGSWPQPGADAARSWRVQP